VKRNPGTQAQRVQPGRVASKGLPFPVMVPVVLDTTPQLCGSTTLARVQHLQPAYFSFMPSVPRLKESAPDAGAQYLGRQDAR
jgi:hypothetical protein